MEINRLIRDPAQIASNLVKLPDKRAVAKKACKIYIPVRYAEHQMAEVGVENIISGIHGMVVDNLYYATCIVNAMIRILPSETNTVVINGEDYYEFVFDKGSTVYASYSPVKIDTFAYLVFDEIIMKGRFPWYIGYNEALHLFDTAEHHAGAKIGKQQEVTELIISMIARDAKDRTKNYRLGIKDLMDLQKTPPAWIPLKNVAYGATNTTNKLAGSYAAYDGLASALVSPSVRVESIERILRQ